MVDETRPNHPFFIHATEGFSICRSDAARTIDTINLGRVLPWLMATAMDNTELGIDYALIVVGSIAVLAGLALLLMPPAVPIHLLGAFSALGGALLLVSGLVDHDSWDARVVALVALEIIAAIVVVVLVLTLHVLPM